MFPEKTPEESDGGFPEGEIRGFLTFLGGFIPSFLTRFSPSGTDIPVRECEITPCIALGLSKRCENSVRQCCEQE